MRDENFSATGKALDELIAIHGILGGDLSRFLSMWSDDPKDQFIRRGVIKALYTYIEGDMYCLKSMALQFESDSGKIIFTEKQRAKLEEGRYISTDEGLLFEKAYLPVEENIKVSFKAFSKVYNLGFVLNTEDKGWHKLWVLRENSVRNRITHPKKTVDMNIPIEDILAAKEVSAWFNAELLRLLNTMIKIQSERQRIAEGKCQKVPDPL